MSDTTATTTTRRAIHPTLKATDKCIAILQELDEDQARRAVLWLAEEFDAWPEQVASIPKDRDRVGS